MQQFLDSTLFTWVLLPLLIFFARIGDVSIGTMRIIMVGRGRKTYAAIMGFFEVSIWLLVARQVITNLPSVACFFAYAAGFATGNFVGMWIEERMASGAQIIRVITQDDAGVLMSELGKSGYGVTLIPGRGIRGSVNILFTIISRRDLKAALTVINNTAPGAFYTVEDVRMAREGVFLPVRRQRFLEFFKRK